MSKSLTVLLVLSISTPFALVACGSRTGLVPLEGIPDGGPGEASTGVDAEAPADGAPDEASPDVAAAPPSLDWAVGFDSVCLLQPGGGAGCFRFPTGIPPLSVDVTLEAVEGVSGATQMAGHEGFCALLSDATVTCWRRMAPGPVRITKPASAISGLDHVVQLDVADWGLRGNGCAVRSDGSVWCWGSNMYNELGIGNHCPKTNPDCDMGTHPPTPVVDLTGAVEVRVTDDDVCARTTAGSVYCWGAIGFPTDLSPDYNAPFLIPGVAGADDVALTATLGVATLADAFVYFGAPSAREGPRGRPTPVTETRAAGERIYGSAYNSFCTKSPGGPVRCRGGFGTTGYQNGADYDVPGTEGALDVNVSTFTGCARMSATDLICWGQYTSGPTRIHIRN